MREEERVTWAELKTLTSCLVGISELSVHRSQEMYKVWSNVLTAQVLGHSCYPLQHTQSLQADNILHDNTMKSGCLQHENKLDLDLEGLFGMVAGFQSCNPTHLLNKPEQISRLSSLGNNCHCRCNFFLLPILFIAGSLVHSNSTIIVPHILWTEVIRVQIFSRVSRE